MDKKTTAGHITALITTLIWGTTFISTKILLTDFTPIEILFFRFLLGLLVLIAVYPKRLRNRSLHSLRRDYVGYAYTTCLKI